MTKRKKTIGILGGMGPEATVRLFQLIVSNTRAGQDADHIPVLIVNDPAIPDRSAFILGDGESPVPALERGLVQLEKMGADFIVIPCNTAHVFLDQIKKRVAIPVLNMITETASWAANEWTHIHKFGLLATTGTYKSQIYHSVFEQHGLEIIIPDTPFIRKTMDAISGIKGIKAGFREAPRSALMETIEHLAGKGVEAIVSGCTEVSLILNQELMNMPFLDPVTILARKSITFAGYELKEPESYAAD